MKLRPWIVFIVLVLLTTLSRSGLAQSKLDAVYAEIDQYRRASSASFEVQLEGAQVKLVRPRLTKIDKATFDQLAKPAAAPALPSLRVESNARVFVWRPRKDLEVEERVVDGPPGQPEAKEWARREFASIASFPIADWPLFLRGAVAHGLSAIEHIGADKTNLFRLEFFQIDADKLEQVQPPVALTPEFREFMRVSREYPAVRGEKGFVLLVHDPHWSVTGRFQLLQGLRALAVGNSGPQNLRFLVEGQYFGSRDITFNGLAEIVERARAQGVQDRLVNELLARHVIDAPLAYRLLDGAKTTAWAIDDNDLLAQSEGVHPEDQPKENAAASEIFKALQVAAQADPKVDQPDDAIAKDLKRVRSAMMVDARFAEALRSPLFALQIAYVLVSRADTSELRGAQLIEHFGARLRLLRAIATLADSGLPVGERTKLKSQIELIKYQIDAYASQERLYKKALERDAVMVREITADLEKPLPGVRVAFIGSFHTAGMTKELAARGIGYAVVEPRNWHRTSAAERKQFDQILSGRTAPAYLEGLSRLNKGWVSPRAEDVERYIKPYSETAIGRASSLKARTGARLDAIRNRRVDPQRLSAALDKSGGLRNAEVAPAADKAALAEPLRRAFAYFEVGDGAREPRLVVVDPTDARWDEPGRYQCLQNMTLAAARQAEGLTSRGTVRFYQELTSNKFFSCYYHPGSNSYYYFDEDGALDASGLLDTKAMLNGEILIHVELVELLRMMLEAARKG